MFYVYKIIGKIYKPVASGDNFAMACELCFRYDKKRIPAFVLNGNNKLVMSNINCIRWNYHRSRMKTIKNNIKRLDQRGSI